MIKAGAFVEITQSDCSLSDNFVSKTIPFSHGWNLPASSPGSAWTPEELAGGVRGNSPWGGNPPGKGLQASAGTNPVTSTQIAPLSKYWWPGPLGSCQGITGCLLCLVEMRDRNSGKRRETSSKSGCSVKAKL